MIEFYCLQIRMGRIRLENVPARWRAEVEKALEKAERKGDTL